MSMSIVAESRSDDEEDGADASLDALLASLDELAEDEAAILAALDEPAPAAPAFKRLPRTGRQRLWAARVAECEALEAQAALDTATADAASEDRLLHRKAMASRELAKLAREAVERGQKTYRANYDAAHGSTPEERRAGWNDAYRERVLKQEGRVARTNGKPSTMTLEQRREYEREREKQKKARQRAAKKAQSRP